MLAVLLDVGGLEGGCIYSRSLESVRQCVIKLSNSLRMCFEKPGVYRFCFLETTDKSKETRDE